MPLRRHLLSEGPDVAAIHADPLLLNRALSNLIANAIRHTPHGGVWRVESGLNGETLFELVFPGSPCTVSR